MTGSDRAQPRCGAPPAAPGSSSRRRLLALLGSLPVMSARSLEAAPERTRAAGAPVDPMPRFFAEFCALLDRHAAALAACDRIEAGLIIWVGYPARDADAVRRWGAPAGRQNAGQILMGNRSCPAASAHREDDRLGTGVATARG